MGISHLVKWAYQGLHFTSDLASELVKWKPWYTYFTNDLAPLGVMGIPANAHAHSVNYANCVQFAATYMLMHCSWSVIITDAIIKLKYRDL